MGTVKSFSDAYRDERTNLLLIDALNLAFRWKHTAKEFSAAFLTTINSLAKSYSAKKIIVLADKGKSKWRTDLYPEYKANRVEQRAKQTEEEAADFQSFIEEYNKALVLVSKVHLVLQYQGYEADDLAAYIVKHFSKKYEHTWLVSTDKDWDLLISNNVSRFSYKNRSEVTLENWSVHYPYKPEQHIDVKVLMGDAGDNIKGISGIGPTRATALLRTYGTVFDLIEELPLPGKAAYIANLNNAKDQLLLNYQLMDLPSFCDEILTDEVKGDINAKLAR